MIIILPTVLFLTLTLYSMNRHQAEDRALRSSYQEMKLITNTLNTLFTTIENFSKLAMINKTYQSVLKDTNGTGEELQRLEEVQQMYASLNAFMESNSYIDSVLIQSAHGNKFYYSNNMSNVTEYTLRMYPREQLLTAKGSAVWIETFESPFLVNDEHKNIISLGRRILDMNSGEVAGYLFINLDERKLAQLYGSDEPDNASKVMLVNGEGKILSANDPELLHQFAAKRLMNTVNGTPKESNASIAFKDVVPHTIIASKMLDNSGWRVLYEIPTAALMKDQWKISLFILGFGAAGFVLSMLLSILFSSWITKPIIQLSRAMAAVGRGRLETRSPVGFHDEVGQLAYKFNEMVGRIQQLLHTINQEEKQKRMLELRLLYSQIKPHFLYNTLEMVRSMALMVQAPDIGRAVKALGDFYRMSLNQGQELIPVMQEKKHLESYLTIQKMRYKHIGYRIDFDAAMAGCWIPNMLLQPLVENAIYHGLREMRNAAMCEITGRIESRQGVETLCFTVKDNGAGMNEEQMNRIWSPDPSCHTTSSFGIRNIQERIQLRFGSVFGLELHSLPGEGVEVTLRLPATMERNEPEERMHASHVS